MKRIRSIAVAAVLAIGTSTFADSVTVDFASTQSVRGLGSFSGSAIYDSSTEQLTLDITNTSSGALTAFAFDVAAGDSAKFVQPSGQAWKDARNHKGIVNAKPYGKFEGGAAVHGNWGATDAKDGLAAGDSETFVFDVTGPTAGSLSTTDFFDTTTPEIVAGFAGFKHHRGDRAAGFGTPVQKSGTTNNEQVGIITVSTPLPSGALAGASLLGLLTLSQFIIRARRQGN